MTANEQRILLSVKNIPIDQLRSLDYFKNRGRQFVERALVQDAQGQRELAFSDAIKSYFEYDYGRFYHLTGGNSELNETVFSTFQWLTTNVGDSVLEEALRASGRKIVNIDQAN